MFYIYRAQFVLSGRNFEWLPGAVEKKALTTLVRFGHLQLLQENRLRRRMYFWLSSSNRRVSLIQ
jgi:hypothetical protein